MVHSFTYNCVSMHFPELDLNSRGIFLSIDRISQPWFCVAHTDPVELCSQSGNNAINHIYFLVHVGMKHASAHNKGEMETARISVCTFPIMLVDLSTVLKNTQNNLLFKRVSVDWMCYKMPTHQQWSPGYNTCQPFPEYPPPPPPPPPPSGVLFENI